MPPAGRPILRAMATESALLGVDSQRKLRPGGRGRVLAWCAGAVVLVLAALVAVVLLWSGVSLNSDASALARVSVQPLGGSIESMEAFGPLHSQMRAARREAYPGAEAEAGRTGLAHRASSPPGLAELGAGERAHGASDAAGARGERHAALADGSSGKRSPRQLRPVGDCDRAGRERADAGGLGAFAAARACTADDLARPSAADGRDRARGRPPSLGDAWEAGAGELVPAVARGGDGHAPGG